MDTGMASILIVSVLSLSLSLMYIRFLHGKIRSLQADLAAANASASYYMDSSDRLRAHVLYMRGEISEDPVAARAQRYGFRLY